MSFALQAKTSPRQRSRQLTPFDRAELVSQPFLKLQDFLGKSLMRALYIHMFLDLFHLSEIYFLVQRGNERRSEWSVLLMPVMFGSQTQLRDLTTTEF